MTKKQIRFEARAAFNRLSKLAEEKYIDSGTGIGAGIPSHERRSQARSDFQLVYLAFYEEKCPDWLIPQGFQI